MSSSDGYNRRFNAVLAEYERKEQCVDDTVHYDSDLEQHWWRTIDFLTRVGQAGIILNPDKFQFAERSVDFAGFRVSDCAIETLPKYLDTIRDFPSPTNTMDIRSWFGLVNQVSNYAQLRDIMAPFKPFLIPRCKFSWSPELESALAGDDQCKNGSSSGDADTSAAKAANETANRCMATSTGKCGKSGDTALLAGDG